MSTFQPFYPSEEWRWVGLPGLGPREKYQISSHGRIRSYKIDKQNGRIIQGSNVGGYKAIPMRRDDGTSISPYLHRLVALHFLPAPKEGQVYVIHKNYNKRHNHAENLQWVSKQEWEAHQRANPNYLGCQSGQWRNPRNAKLTESDVMRMKMMLKRGKNRLKTIARQFGITHTQLNRIRRGENWSHVRVE